MRSAMTVPMVARGGTLGAMTFVTGPSGRRFDQRDLELAEELARRCATAVENARLYGERAYIARTLQESLLPSELPEIPGIESAARFRPTGEGHEMGGDFYDLFSSGGRGLDGGDGRRVRQGPGRGGRDGAGPLHAARRGHARAPAEPRPPRAERGAAAPAHRPPLLHRRLRLPRVDRERTSGSASPAAGTRCRCSCARTASWSRWARPARCSAWCPTRASRTARWSSAPGDALVFYTDGVIEDRGDGGLEEERAGGAAAGCAGKGADAIAARVEEEAVALAGRAPTRRHRGARAARGGPRDG